MKSKKITNILLAASLAASTPALMAEEKMDNATKPEMKEEAMETPEIEEGSLTTTIQDSVTFSILSAALKASGLDVTLGQKGTYTIFAPTDEAFQKLDKATLDKLLLPENKEKLRSLLLYHVVAGNVMAADLKDEMKVKTMNGEMLEIDIDGDEVKANDSKVFSTDVVATNGVMHSVGEVIIPESLEGFASLDD